MYIYIPVKDLYYQKYLKYKNKYLNLCNQLGGVEYSIGYSIDIKDNTIRIYYEGNNDKRFISNLSNELNKPNITTIVLEDVIVYYFIIIRHLQQVSSFPNIKTLIFDNNDLSSDDNIQYFVNLIKLFNNVTTLSFKNCQLNKDSSKYLLRQLFYLKQRFSLINLDDNPRLTDYEKKKLRFKVTNRQSTFWDDNDRLEFNKKSKIQMEKSINTQRRSPSLLDKPTEILRDYIPVDTTTHRVISDTIPDQRDASLLTVEQKKNKFQNNPSSLFNKSQIQKDDKKKDTEYRDIVYTIPDDPIKTLDEKKKFFQDKANAKTIAN